MAEGAKKLGRNEGKCKTYASQARAERNATKRAQRHAKHVERMAKRRALGKRNAYLEGRNGRGHRKGAPQGPATFRRGDVRHPMTKLREDD